MSLFEIKDALDQRDGKSEPLTRQIVPATAFAEEAPKLTQAGVTALAVAQALQDEKERQTTE